jgi:hypothetical protein
MSNTDPLAHKIAQLIEASISDSKHASIFAALEKINHRLDKLEAAQDKPAALSNNLRSHHPSLEKFAITEAVADAIFAAKPDEKTCTFEPNGRPCDHCSMCSARGF